MQRTSPDNTSKKNNDSEDNKVSTLGFFNPSTTATPCSNGQCMRPPKLQAKTPSVQVNPATTVKDAALEGFAYSFLSELPAEFTEDYLQEHHYSPAEIRLICQTIRYSGWVGMGASANTLAIPFLSYLLSSATGIDDTYADIAASLGVYLYNVCTEPSQLPGFDSLATAASYTLKFAISVAASCAGQRLAKLCHDYTSDLIAESPRP